METVPAGTKLGRYEVLKQLAKGGMADLLLARTTGLEGFERHVVIKQIREEQAKNAKFVQMFVTEARLAGALHHHNIVQVQDIGEQDGRHYFAMEYVHGEDLRKLLHTLVEGQTKLPLEHVITIVASVAAALHHAHEAKAPDGKPLGIVHRDVTPVNILVGYDGNVKVVDFGIAKAAASAVETDQGVLKGKVPYMTPEQCTGKTVDRRSDVFALGIVAYELVTARRLFKGDNDFMTMSAIVSGEVPRPSKFRLDIPSRLEGIILKALARSPSDRYQTADEMRGALEDYAGRAGMRMSANALAAYMKKLFGERPEPWREPGGGSAEEITVDFDGTVSGMAPPPNEVVETFAIPSSMQATKSSPIRQAYSRALDGTPTNAMRPSKQLREVASMKPSTSPPPLQPSRPLRALTPETQSVFGGETTDVDVKTDVASPPPLPKVMVKEVDRESTEIVAPLEIASAPRAPAFPKARRKRGGLIAALLLALAGGGAGAYYYFVYLPDGEAQTSWVPVEPVVAKPAPAPEPPKVPSDDIPFEQRTANNTPAPKDDTPTPEPAKPAPAPPETAVAPPEPPPAPAIEAKPTPPKPDVKPAAPAKVAAAKPTPKPATKHSKPATKTKSGSPQWDPDALFLKKN